MRIGILSYDFLPSIGGMGMIVRTEEQELNKAFPQNEYFVFSPSKDAPIPVSALARARWNKLGGCPLFSITLLWRLPRRIRGYALDVVHAHCGSGGVFILRKPSCPLVLTSHHTYRQEASMVFSGFFLKRLWKRFMSVLERRTYAIADAILCVSEDTRQELIEHYGVDPQKVHTLENCIDLETYMPAPERKRDGNVILFVGRLEDRKGVWVLLHAFHILVKKYPDLQLRLIGKNLVGDSLFHFIRKRGLEKSVAVLGHLDEPLMLRELQEAGVVAVPSLIEGFGLIAAQAMAAGCCVVASDCPGLRSIITDKKTGLLFKTGSAEDCAQKLESALRDPALAHSMMSQAAHEAVERFSCHLHSQTLQACYNTVCNE